MFDNSHWWGKARVDGLFSFRHRDVNGWKHNLARC